MQRAREAMGGDGISPVDESPGNDARREMMAAVAEVQARQRQGG